jgi:pimeloyl-ACP methyl ester carboxylesterase
MTQVYRSQAGADAVHERYRQLLDRSPLQGERLLLLTRHGDTFVLAAGPVDAPPLIVLPGSGGNTAMWLPQLEVWSKRYRVFAVDVIGEPGFSAPARPPLTSDAHALWLDDVLQGLHLERTSMVGVSLGGFLALDYATRRPHRVSRLALFAPSGIGRSKVSFLAAAVLLRPFGERGRRRMMRLALGIGDGRPIGNDYLSDPLVSFAMLISAHFRHRMEVIPVLDDDKLRTLTMPVLTVLGGRDALLDSRGTAARLKAVAPHVTVVLLPEYGHFLPGQTEYVLDFLDGKPVGAGGR